MIERHGSNELPVPPELPNAEGRSVFPESWRRPFAIVVAMFENKHYTWPEWVDYFSAELKPEGHYKSSGKQKVKAAADSLSGNAEHIEEHYTEHWIAACEKLLIAKGLLSKEEVDHLAVPPAGAITAEQSEPRFKRGDQISVRDIEPVGHAHLPEYLRGKRGTVERNLGAFTFPDTDQPGTAEGQRHMYSVRFAAREVWGLDASARDSLFFNIWDFYINPG